MVRKPLVIATMAAALGIATVSTQASAGDPLLGAIVGGGIGAAIGHSAGGRDGGVVGGVLGAVVGSSIAAESGYYDRGYYYGAPPAYYGPAYYAPPVYAAPVVVYSSSYPRYRYVRDYRHDRRDWHDGHRR